jgi:hypothetical protein
LTSKKFIKTTYIPHFNNHFGDGCHLPVLNQFNMITYFLKMICKSQQCHSSIYETFNFSFIKSFILIMRFKRPFSYAYLELLSRESLAVAKNPSPPHLSQTPKKPKNIIQEKLYNIANDITFFGLIPLQCPMNFTYSRHLQRELTNGSPPLSLTTVAPASAKLRSNSCISSCHKTNLK